MLDDTPKESSLEDYLQKRVKAMGGKCLKFVSPGTAGVADRLVILPCRAPAFLELKKLGEEPKPLQAKFIRDMVKLGQVAGWADSVEMVDRFMRKLLND